MNERENMLFRPLRTQDRDEEHAAPSLCTHAAPSLHRGRNHPLREEREVERVCIQQSIALADMPEREFVSLGGTIVPLPGFDDNLSCKLCQIKLRGDGSVLDSRLTSNGATLSEFLHVAHEEFHQEEGRPAMDVAEEILSALCRYGSSSGITLLSDLTKEEVYRHFRYDHGNNRTTKIGDKIIRRLDRMMDISVAGCCEKMENGTVILNKTDASLFLNIVDRYLKTASQKDG